MKQLHALFFLFFLACFTACENAIIDEDSDTTTDEVIDSDVIDGNQSDDDDTTKGDGSGDNSQKIDASYISNYTIQGEEVYTVAGFLNMEEWSPRYWVVGYIVGDCSYKIENANFTAPFSQPGAILLADDPNERDTNKMMSVKLTGSKRDTYSLKSHPENQGKKLFVITGTRTVYLNIDGMVSDNSGIGSMGWLDDKKDQ